MKKSSRGIKGDRGSAQPKASGTAKSQDSGQFRGRDVMAGGKGTKYGGRSALGTKDASVDLNIGGSNRRVAKAGMGSKGGDGASYSGHGAFTRS
jgi:hypothetical protein